MLRNVSLLLLLFAYLALQLPGLAADPLHAGAATTDISPIKLPAIRNGGFLIFLVLELDLHAHKVFSSVCGLRALKICSKLIFTASLA